MLAKIKNFVETCRSYRYRYVIGVPIAAVLISFTAAFVSKFWPPAMFIAPFTFMTLPGMTLLIGVMEYYEREAEDDCRHRHSVFTRCNVCRKREVCDKEDKTNSFKTKRKYARDYEAFPLRDF